MAAYWLTGGKNDGEGRVVEDRGAIDESVVFRDESWKYGRGFYMPEDPARYVETDRGDALVLCYVGDSLPSQI
jgi:hypothetical protein